MTQKAALLIALLALAGCGADGEPVKPDVGVKTSVGVNSKTGASTSTSVTIRFPSI